MSPPSPSRPSQSTRNHSPNLQRSKWWKRTMLPSLLTAATPARLLYRSFLCRQSPRLRRLNPNHTPLPSSTRGHRQFTEGTAASRPRDPIPSHKPTTFRTTDTQSRPSRRGSGREIAALVGGGGEVPEGRRHASRSGCPITSGQDTGDDGGGWRSASDCGALSWFLVVLATCCRYPPVHMS